tara:strand:+ start:391 stop:528 length:138 start_codon:yes stop_codon:yes gene_type:complete
MKILLVGLWKPCFVALLYKGILALGKVENGLKGAFFGHSEIIHYD